MAPRAPHADELTVMSVIREDPLVEEVRWNPKKHLVMVKARTVAHAKHLVDVWDCFRPVQGSVFMMFHYDPV